MARIEPIEDVDNAPARLRALLYFAEAEGGPDQRMAKIQGRSEVGLALLEAWRVALFGGILPHKLKELLRIRMSILEECGYCSSVRTTQGGIEGVTDELLLDLPKYETSGLFSPRERVALRYADWFKTGLPDDGTQLDSLRDHFSEPEIVELGVFCGFMLQGRFAKSLNVVSWDEACALNPSLRAASGKDLVSAGGSAS